MFHCGDLKERKNKSLFPSQGVEEIGALSHAELTRKLAEIKSMRNFLFLLGVSASLAEHIGNIPLLEERDRVRCLTSQIKNNFAIASEGEAIQPIFNSKFVNESTSSRPSPQVEGVSCPAEHIVKFPSPRVEGVGERVVSLAKLEPLKRFWIIGRSAGSTQPSPRRASLLPKSAVQGDIMKKCAFTLAEVLITLGIIGVVAAITLPNLMTAYKAITLRSQFMKSHSLIQQAYKMMQADNVSTSPSDYDRSNEEDASFKTVFRRYFTGTTDCGLNGANMNFPCLKGSSPTYKLLLGDSFVPITLFDDGEFALKDGTLLIFENPSGAPTNLRVWIFVDINGISHKPNRLGYDLFTFQLTDEGLKTMGDEGTDFVGDNYCSFSTNGYLNGITCANKAKNDPDYFKKVVKAIK